jgi:hypothetical protein
MCVTLCNLHIEDTPFYEVRFVADKGATLQATEGFHEE